VVRAVRSHERGCDLDDEGCGEHGAEHASIEKGGPEDNDGPGPDQVADPWPQRTAARDRDPPTLRPAVRPMTMAPTRTSTGTPRSSRTSLRC
jgi:hypothetical protein